MKKTIKNYVSPIDIQMAEFDKTHALSDSQLAEIKKYRKVNYLRDEKKLTAKTPVNEVWEDF